MRHRALLWAPALVVALAAGGCGGSSPQHQAATGGGGAPAGALSGEARSAATGDIPDNQVFVSFRETRGGFAISYPEGWTQAGSGRDVRFANKNNIVHVVIAAGAAPTSASVRAELMRLRASNPTLKFGPLSQVALRAGPAIKATYTTESAPNPVTGKRLLLIVDRYELASAGRRATLDLGTPQGVDNVDAYKQIANSFRWL